MALVGEALVAIRPETSGFASGLESKLQGALAGVPAPVAAVGAAITALGVTAFAVGEKFQGAFNKIKVGTGETGPALDSLDASFKRVLSGTAGSFDQVAAAISGLHQRTGLLGPALDDMAKKEVTLARITKTDVGANVEATTALFNKFGIAAKDQSAALDVLFKASQNGGKGLDTLTAEMQKGGVALQELGFSLPQAAALISNLEKAGVNTGPVLSGLTKTLGTLAKEGKDPQEAFQGLIKEIQGAGSESEALGLTIKTFGAKAGPELVAAIRSGKFEFADLAKQLADGKGGINETGASVSTLGSKFARLKNEVLVAMEPAGAALVKFANEGLGKILQVLPGVIDAVTKAVRLISTGFTNPQIGVALDSWQGALVRFGQVLRTVFDFIQDHAKPILIALGVAFVGMVSPVALVIGALVLLYTHFQGVRDVVGAVVDYVETVWPKIAEAVTHVMNVIRDVITVVLEVIRVYWAVWGDAIMAVVGAAFEQIRNTVETVIRIVANVIKLVLDLINGDWGAAWDDIKGILSAAWDFIQNAVEIGINLIWELFKALPGKLLGALVSLGGDLFDLAARALSNMYDAVANGVGDMVSLAESIPGRVGDAIGDLVGIMADIGYRAVRAMADAIGDAIGWVLSAAGDLVSRVKDKLEFWRSPPEAYGLHIGRRLVGGLVDALNETAQVEATASKLVQSAKNRLDAGGAAAGGGPGQPAGARALQAISSRSASTIAPAAEPALQSAISALMAAIDRLAAMNVGGVHMHGVADPYAAARAAVAELEWKAG